MTAASSAAAALALAVLLSAPSAWAACDKITSAGTPISNQTVTCGTTTNQNAPNGWGTGNETNNTINVTTNATVTGTSNGFSLGDGNTVNVNNASIVTGVVSGISAASGTAGTLTVNNTQGTISATQTFATSSAISVSGSEVANVTNSDTITGVTGAIQSATSQIILNNQLGGMITATGTNQSAIIAGQFPVMGASFTGSNAGTITSQGSAITSSGTITITTNSGTISATSSAVNVGIGLFANGDVTVNANTGTISGGFTAIQSGGNATVTNSNIISAGIGFGISATGNATVTNNQGASITSGSSAVQANNNVTVTNSGTMTSSNGIAIAASSGTAMVTNNQTGTITSSAAGQIAIAGNSVTLNNAGMIQETGGTGAIAVFSANGGPVNVTNSGTIQVTGPAGASVAIESTASTGTNVVNNSGTISSNGVGGAGVNVGSALTLTNTPNGGSPALIQANGAGSVGVLANAGSGAVTVTNGGTISGGGNGINTNTTGLTTITNTGTISNTTGGGATPGDVRVNVASITNMGTINGADFGILFRNGHTASTIFNSGTITGTGGTAIQFSSGSTSNTLTLAPSFAINGNVTQGAGNILQLGGSSGSGTFNVGNIGTQYQNFTTFNKIDTSTWTLTGTNAATLPWTINGGTLAANGTMINSTMTVNNGGTLEGIGTVSSITVNAGATLMPGLPATVGTLTAGPVTFASGATYLIAINGATNSKVNSSGLATLNGSASVNIASGSTINFGQTYTILTASGGVTGTFNPNVTFGAFSGTLSYDAHDAFLTFAFPNLVTGLPAGSPQNVVNVANAIDNFAGNGGMLPPGFQNFPMLTSTQLANALTELSGELGTGAQLSAFQLMNEFMTLLLDPLAGGHGFGIGALPFAPTEQQTTFTPEVANAYASVLKAPAAPIMAYGPWRAWGAAFGGSNSITGDPVVVGSHDVRTTAGGFAAGLDYRVSPDTVLGIALAGAGTGWDLSAGLGSGHSDAFQAGLYAKHQYGPAYLAGALAFANYWASTSRAVTVAGTDTLHASFDAQSFGGRLEGGYRISLAPVTVTPYAALQAQSFRLPGYSETAASGSPQFALSFAGQTSTAERAELGAWLSRSLLLANGDTLALFSRAAWAHDWFSNLAVTPSFQALPGASFVVNGAAPPHDLALVTAGAEWRLRTNWSLMGRFDGEFGDGQQTYTGTARVRYAW